MFIDFKGLKDMKNRQAAGVVTAIFLAGVLVVALYKVGAPGKRDTKHSPVLPPGVRIALEGTTRISSVEKGESSWIMTCQGLEFHQPKERQPGLVKVSAPVADIPLEDGGTARVKARQGVYCEQSEDIVLEEGIHAEIFAEGRRQWVIYGETASYRGGENYFYVSAMRGTMYPAEGGTVDLRGDKARYDSDAETMHLNGDVNIKLASEGRTEWELSGSTASYHRKEDVYYLAGVEGLYTPRDGNTVTIEGKNARYLADPEVMRIFNDVYVELYRQGLKEWVLEGETASYWEKEDTYHVSRMKARRFDKTGQVMAISGRKGTYDAGSEKMTISGEVTVNWESEVTLETERLDYDAGKKTAATDSGVRITGKDWTASGRGLWANTETEKVIIKRDVKMEFERGFSGKGAKQ